MLIILLEGGESRCAGRSGDRALHRASRANNDYYVSILIEHGADVSKENNEGQTPLDVAATDELAQLLLEAGAE